MSNYKEIYALTGQPEYDVGFWNYMKGIESAENKLQAGRNRSTGTYSMPVTSSKKYEDNICAESVLRNIATVFTNYTSGSRIWAADSDDIAEFVGEFESIPVNDVKNDFTKISVDSNKLAVLFRVPDEFARDSAFIFENYLLKRLSKCFAKAEDKAFILGSGIKEPVGIIHESEGAEIGTTTDRLTYDDVIKLYFSIKPEYRKNGVWLMNDETAQTLRTIKDNSGNYLWRNTDDAILGKRVIISEYMPNAENESKPIAFGDFSYYWIIKRSQVTVKVLRELFSENGQLGYLAFEFIDGKLVRKDAVKVLKIAK